MATEFTLREYQEADVQFLVDHHRIYNTNEPGLGKTLETLEGLRRLRTGPVLVLGTKVSLGVWQHEIKKWLGVDAMIYGGTPRQREKLWDQFRNAQQPGMKAIPFLLATFKMAAEIRERKSAWPAIVCDEIHRGGLLNHKTVTYKAVERLRSRYMVLLTGTPIRQGPQDLYAPMHLLDPFAFPSYWPFVGKHCVVINDDFGKTLERMPKDAKKLRAAIAPYFIRHTKREVAEDMPPKTRIVIPVELTKGQRKIYDKLCLDMYAELDDGVIVAPTQMTLLLRLRQLLVAPQLLGVMEDGAALTTILEMMEDQFLADRSIAITTPFRQAIPFIMEALKRAGLTHLYQIHGQLTTKEMIDASEAYQADKNVRKVMVYTIRSGQSFSIPAATTLYMLGSEWSAIDNKQAEDRLHRLTQLHPVDIYYPLHKGTVDDLVLERLNDKQRAEDWVLKPKEVLTVLKKLS